MQSVRQRRTHLKTRNGCTQCKRRKIKCDENGLEPCAQCVKSRYNCSFAPPVDDTEFSTTTRLDLELLHNFTINTAKLLSEKPVIQSFFATDLVHLALQNDHLLHCIMALSAFHIVKQRSCSDSIPSSFPQNLIDVYLQAAYRHHEKALTGYRQSLSNITYDSCHAILACACLLVMVSFARPSENEHQYSRFNDPDYASNWLGFRLSEWIILIKGPPSIVALQELLPILREGPIAPMMRPRSNISTGNEGSLSVIHAMQPRLLRLSEAIREECTDDRVIQICQSSISKLHEVAKTLEPGEESAFCFIWPMRVDPEYLVLLEEKRPEALLVFTYYCTFIHSTSTRWWVEGWPRPFLESIRDTIEKKWLQWLQWPLEIVLGSENKPTAEQAQ